MHRLTSTLLLGISFLIFFASATETGSQIGGKNERYFPPTETADIADLDTESPFLGSENNYTTIANEDNSTTQITEKDSTSWQTTESVAETTDDKTTDQHTTVPDEPSSTVHVHDQPKYKDYIKPAHRYNSFFPMTTRNGVTNFSKVIEDYLNLLHFETKATVVSSEIFFGSGCPFSFSDMEAANIVTSAMRFGPVEEEFVGKTVIHSDNYYNQLEVPVMYVGSYETVNEVAHFMMYDNFLNLSGPWLPVDVDGLSTLTNWDIEDTYNILGYPIPLEKPFEFRVRENFTIVLNWYLETVKRSSNWELDVILNGYLTTYFLENVLGTNVHVYPFSALANKEFSSFGNGLHYKMKGELMASYGKRLSVEILTYEGPTQYGGVSSFN